MPHTIEAEPLTLEPDPHRVARMFGGRKLLGREVRTKYDAHDLLAGGLPNGAVQHFLKSLLVMNASQLSEAALGMSVRTLQRKKDQPDMLLDSGHSARAWEFAELLGRAEDVFGSRRDAETWFLQPAIGLNRKRPIDLVSTPAGRELVEAYLNQINSGVYV